VSGTEPWVADPLPAERGAYQDQQFTHNDKTDISYVKGGESIGQETVEHGRALQ
jgi:hypothetical protein